MIKKLKIAFLINLPFYYLNNLFEIISKNYDVNFIFYSKGDEKWINKNNNLKIGNYCGYFINGIKLSNHLRLNVKLLINLLSYNYNLYIQYINGPIEILTTFIVARLRGKPFILYTDLWFHPDTLFHKLSFPIIKYIYLNANAIIVWGTHVSRFLMSLGVKKEKIFYSWGVIDNHLFNKIVSKAELKRLKQKYNLNNKCILLFVGRLSYEKGLLFLLEAYKKVTVTNNCSLLLIGEGEQKAELVNYININRLSNVHFLNYVNNKDLYKYYCLADIFILPSISTKTLREVWGLVINEAMNQRCPIITTNIVGAAIGGLLENGKDSIIIEEKNTDQLFNAINQLVLNPRKRFVMGKYAYKKIFNWDYYKSYNGFKDAINYSINKS